MDRRVRSAAGLAVLAVLVFGAAPLYGQDVTPPQLSILAPERRVVVNEPRPEIRVGYSDGESGVALGSLRVALDGRDLTAGCLIGPTEASCLPAALRPGTHSVDAEIFDLAGNRGAASFAFVLLLGGGPHEVVLPAAGDTFLWQVLQNQNFGEVPLLPIGPGPTSRVLVRFDAAEVAAVAGAGELTAAGLEIHLAVNAGTWGPGRPVGVHRVTEEWADDGATWRCPIDADPGNLHPDCPEQWGGGAVEADPTDSVLHTNGLAGWLSFEVTADVSQFAAGTPDHGWMIRKPPQGAQNGTAFYASREGPAGKAPRLRLVFETPEFADTTPPALAIVAPSEPLVVNDPSPPILVTFVDGGFGADPESLRIALDGADLTAACTVGPASALCEPGALAGGPHLVSASVSDLVGNEATASFVFVLLLDTEPPSVAIATPAAGAVVASPSLAVEGTVADGDQVVSVVVNGHPATVTGIAFAAEVALGQGTNTVRAEATDRAGNRGSVEISVVLDTEPPALTVETPPPGQLTNSATVRVAGQAQDPFGVAAVDVGGTAASFADGRFEAEVDLAEGINDLLVRATDLAGNVRALTLQVRRLTVPTIAITSPPDLRRTTAIAVDVAGTVSDPAATVVVEGIPATVTGNAFLAADVPLAIGGNFLSAVATSPSGAQASAKVTVIRDLLPPHVAIYQPRDGEVVFEDAVAVSGLVNDIVLGTVNDTEATVTVNGIPAQVENRSFLVPDVPLAPGPNLITARAVDPTGNLAETTIEVVRAETAGPSLTRVSGDLQTALAGTLLPEPLLVRVTDAAGQPVAGQAVYFRVLEGSGTLGGAGRRQVALPTDGAGLVAVSFTLGSRAGTGNHQVEATAAGFAGRAVFTASALPGPAAHLFLDDGDQQEGQVSQVLPDPLVAVVTDSGFNRLAGVPVTFRVVEGGGAFAGGESETTVTSDADGRVVAEWRLGSEPGVAAHVAEAFLASSPEGPVASFTATGIAAGDPASTAIRGVVLDNMNQPVPGVTLRLLDTALTTQADANGFFRLAPVPVGSFLLIADGSTAQRPGLWPDLEFSVTTVAGHENSLGMPIYLLPIDQGRGVFVSETQGGTIELDELPGFALEIAAGSVTFPGGGRSGVVSATVVHGDRVPMVPNFGQQPRLIVTIQPAGATFDPPARFTLPNVDGLAPGEVTELYSFDHDLASFVSIGPGTVSEDGTVLVSNPGVGVIKAGWHCGGNPSTSGTAANCPQCQTCQRNRCVPVGGGCDDGDECTVNDRCVGGACVADPVLFDLQAKANGKDDLIVRHGSAVSFATVATAPDCPSLEYSWDLGDGTTSTASALTHTYAAPGSYSASVTVTCGSCGSRTDAVRVRAVELEIFEVTTPSDTSPPPADNSFLAPDDQIQVRGRVVGAPELNSRIEWRSEAVGGHTGASNPTTAQNTDSFAFNARSNLPTTGSRDPNPPLGYGVVARLPDTDPSIEDLVPPLNPISQDERDRMRQEYRDYQTILQPPRSAFDLPVRAAYNVGNYSLVINGEMPNLEASLAGALNAILTTPDTQLVAPCPCLPTDPLCLDANPGQCRLQRLSAIILAGTNAIASRPTNPSFNRRVIVFRGVPAGDDEYCDPATGAASQVTAVGSSICAGPNGRAETAANTVNYQVPALAITSGYRNPQRNRAAGSLSPNSLHTRGRALDVGLIGIPGLTPGTNAQCVLELAGDASTGAANAFIERGPTIVPCDDGSADHIHVQSP